MSLTFGKNSNQISLTQKIKQISINRKKINMKENAANEELLLANYQTIFQTLHQSICLTHRFHAKFNIV